MKIKDKKLKFISILDQIDQIAPIRKVNLDEKSQVRTIYTLVQFKILPLT